LRGEVYHKVEMTGEKGVKSSLWGGRPKPTLVGNPIDPVISRAAFAPVSVLRRGEKGIAKFRWEKESTWKGKAPHILQGKRKECSR